MAGLAKRRASSRGRKQELLRARFTPDQMRLIERAAELRGTTVTEFVVASVQQAAADVIEDFEVLTLRDEARKVFVDSLLNPPPPNAAAGAASERYKTQFGG